MCCLQGIVEKLKEVHVSPANKRWADLLSDRSMSRSRRMKSVVIQLFAARYALEEAFLKGQEAIIATFECNSVMYSCGIPSSIAEASEDDPLNIHSRSEISRRAKSRKKLSQKRKKDSHSQKHCSKGKRKRHLSDSDDGSLLEFDAAIASPTPAHWRISFGSYSGECTVSDAAECLHMMSACIRMDVGCTL